MEKTRELAKSIILDKNANAVKQLKSVVANKISLRTSAIINKNFVGNEILPNNEE